MFVTKSNGEKEPLDIEKIRKQMNFCILGTDITATEFEAKFNLIYTNNMETSAIQSNLVQISNNSVSIEEPDWNIVSGRAAMWRLYSKVLKNTGFAVTEWVDHIKWLCDNNYYKPEIYTKLLELGITKDFIKFGDKKHYSLDNQDFQKNISQTLILESKYIIVDEGKPLEYPFLIDIANAILLADNKQDFERKFFMFFHGYLSLATPFKRNLRRVNGNTGSCFIGDTPDALSGIFKSYNDMAHISKEGGGIGWYWGKVRPGYTSTYTIVNSNQITAWIKIVSDLAVAVDQAGVRKAAITVGLDWWHLDILSFLEIKSEVGTDLRFKAFDIFPQIIIDDYFVDKYYRDEPVYLYNHFDFYNLTGIDITELVDEELFNAHVRAEQLILEGKLTHYVKIAPSELLKKTVWTWIEIGDFYIAHKDMINFSNYLKVGEDKLTAKCVNLCVESFSVNKTANNYKEEVINGKRKTTESDGMYHSCNLISINVEKFSATDELLPEVTYHAVDCLDKSVDLSTYPVLEAEQSAKALRNIGIGILGKADYMAYNGYMYDTENGRLAGQALVEKIAYNAYMSSIRLAKEKGSYPLFDKRNYNKIIGRTVEELNAQSLLNGNCYDWNDVYEGVQDYGIRNFYLLAMAPNTSTGVLMGVLPSYLPAYNKFNYQTLNDMSVPILPKYIKDKYWYYKTRYQYDPVDIIKYTEYCQFYVDTGMSMEINISTTVNPDIYGITEAFMEGFKNKRLKAVYYVMTIDPKTGKVAKKSDTKEEVCIDCAN